MNSYSTTVFLCATTAFVVSVHGSLCASMDPATASDRIGFVGVVAAVVALIASGAAIASRRR